ncbi:FAD/NAD(P)-binding protein [Sandaracinus amylolyticus]|uniref:FAD/NAD(P)-binding protein n=1 Tax=Sandaracinus amylolyticus TaxID=927083 RepID=UPI001F1CC41D|nr:FAD/NAD(P)-binding protein [Sandaracinus amylolyticus]
MRREDAIALLAGAELEWDDVAPFVSPGEHGYTRRRIARTDAFEMLVMTWRPGQRSAPHDHAGSLCALRVMRGSVHETRFSPAPDGLVDPRVRGELREGEVAVDTTEDVHALSNDAADGSLLVTLHVYAPPLPELRRFAARPSETRALPIFARPRAEGAPTVAVIGGGFSGTLAAAHLVRLASHEGRALHVVIVDRQAAFGEGAAYRTADARHLLNVPASNMSAWPDRREHFLAWARRRDPEVAPTDFLPRRLYGEYVRDAFFEVASESAESVSAEIVRAEVHDVRRDAGRWILDSDRGAAIHADAIVVATGHRPPECPIGDRWSGSRSRYIEDPWASLALSAIAPDEPVVLLGTGLTAVDVLLTIARAPREAPVTAISRRGLAPASHATSPVRAIDPSEWLDPLLERGPTARTLVRDLRGAVARAEDWRAVIDGLRPHTARVWRALPEREATRLLRHARAYWEVRRHRVAPPVAAILGELESRGVFRTLAGRVLAARADDEGITLDVRARGAIDPHALRTAWIVNCTGPGSGARLADAPGLGALLRARHLELDRLGLGVRTDEHGRAREGDRVRGDLLVIGTLRKPDLWESTAVPELREQARDAARTVLDHLADHARA